MIDLLPKYPLVHGCVNGGVQYMSMASIDLMLAEMQLTNARDSNGKPEYHDLLAQVRQKFAGILWNKPTP